jgi:RNA polymerase sigma-70 factor (ECF subfamily)
MRLLTGILRSKARAEEVLQETFIAAFRSIATFRGEVSLSTWLARIATNRAYNSIRNDARAKRTAPPAGDEPISRFEPRVEERDLARKVLAILEHMDPPKKLALLLQAEGYTVAEIAEISGEPRGTILARLSRSRAELSLRMVRAGLAVEAIPASVEERT